MTPPNQQIEDSNIKPTQGEIITIKRVERMINKALENAKRDFLITAKLEASEEIRKQVQTDKSSLITVFGVFASVISFLTIEFQFLRTLCSFEKLIGFTLVLAALLLCFNISLDYLVKVRTDKDTPKPNLVFTLFVISLFVAGVCFTNFGNEKICTEYQVFEKYTRDFESKQDVFNKLYEESQNEQYNSLVSRIKVLEDKLGKLQ